MWNNLCKPVFALSLGLNMSFIGIWLFHSLSTPGNVFEHSHSSVDNSISSALHREIGVTEEQWGKIEPLVLDLQEKSEKQRQQVTALRSHLMDLLTMPEVNHAAIRETQEQILAGQRRMQNLVIDHLLKEKEFLSPEQGIKLMQSLCEQCRLAGG